MSRLLIQYNHLYKAFGSLPLFEDVSLSINEGERVALIGENGSGKTTLLEILASIVPPDKGECSQMPHLKIGFLPQEVSSDLEVRAYLEESPCLELERKMNACLDDPDRLAEWGELHEKFEQLGGYKRLPIEKVLHGLKLETSLLNFSMNSLSSGQRVRVALAKSLMENPDLLLLDEPTNHLDIEMLEWLKEMLLQREGATLIVSHDRKFLNETCSQLIEIKNKKLNRYGGSYDFYLEEKERQLEQEIKSFEKQREERANLKQKIKAATFSKRKAAPPKDRNIMAYDKSGEQHQKSVQRSLDLMKRRLAEIEANLLPHPKPKTIKGLKFTPNSLSSTILIELEEISKKYGNKELFSSFTHSFSKGDKVIITGPNGSGKTTLLRCLAGLTMIDSGKIRFASEAKVAYLDQDCALLPMEKSPLHYFEERFRLSEEMLRKELHKAALGGEELINRPFSNLSVGQRKRLMLLSLTLEKPNILLLDEPTNHLDFLTLEALEKALLNFDGVLIAVSHDKTFIEKIGTTLRFNE